LHALIAFHEQMMLAAKANGDIVAKVVLFMDAVKAASSKGVSGRDMVYQLRMRETDIPRDVYLAFWRSWNTLSYMELQAKFPRTGN
jgi:hypothetical protein